MAKQFNRIAGQKRYDINAVASKLPANYDPAKGRKKFMGPEMLAYFWSQLTKKRAELSADNARLREVIGTATSRTDMLDFSVSETEKTNARGQIESNRILAGKLTMLIDDIERKGTDSEYGYSEESGEAIPVERLKIQPWATRTVEEQSDFDIQSRGYRKGMGPAKLERRR